MNPSLIKGIIILPGTAFVFIPALILRLSTGSAWDTMPANPTQARYWIGWLAVADGLALAVWSARLFVTRGEGTPAPWDPPRKLVVRGPYRYVRNPMLTGGLLILAGESLLYGSWPVAGWMLAFFLLYTTYLLRGEEPGLERRFGDDYRRYKANVPRWIPSLKPWDLP